VEVRAGSVLRWSKPLTLRAFFTYIFGVIAHLRPVVSLVNGFVGKRLISHVLQHAPGFLRPKAPLSIGQSVAWSMTFYIGVFRGVHIGWRNAATSEFQPCRGASPSL